MSRIPGVLLLSLLLPVLGCEGESQDRSSPPTSGPPVAAEAVAPPPRDSLSDLELGTLERQDIELNLRWSRSPVRKAAEDGMPPVQLRAVEVRGREGFDRLIVEMGPDDPSPGYRVEITEEPVRECGSGRPVETKGNAVLRVRLEPARAHDASGAATLPRDTIRPRRNIRSLDIVCDFEGVVELALGIGGSRPYRILELRNPRRLVVDLGNTLGG